MLAANISSDQAKATWYDTLGTFGNVPRLDLQSRGAHDDLKANYAQGRTISTKPTRHHRANPPTSRPVRQQ